MKYKVLSVPPRGGQQNIGDYVQALASAQFLPSFDGFINRELLSDYNEEDAKLIMNGWFMHHPENWPPSDKIKPLFVAFHLNVTASDILLDSKTVGYFRKYEPIGCRDIGTKEILEKNGIKAFFSGCLTLTLGLKYKCHEKTNLTYIVDPYIPNSKSFRNLLNDFFYTIANPNRVIKISRKLFFNKLSLRNIIKTGRFLRLYSKVISKDILLNSIYVTQQSVYYTSFETDAQKLHEAERLVKMYAKAKLVVTSRIHCALPCLGLETPVIFTYKENSDIVSSCRYKGLLDLFNIFSCSENNVKMLFPCKGVVSLNNCPKNKESWKQYAINLSRLVQTFINDDCYE